MPNVIPYIQAHCPDHEIAKEVKYETFAAILAQTAPANAISMAYLDKIGLQKLYKIIQPRFLYV